MPGPFYFAWVDDTDTTFDPVAHKVEDESIYAFTLNHEEGDFARLSIDIRNPRIGLLNVSRKVWAWFSFFDGTDMVPIFFGRLIGVPSNVFADVVTLDFIARPKDFEAQKQALADTLRVAPYWDPIFIALDQLEDPDLVLEGRSAMWHIDRVTHQVTISDVLVGEDGTMEFQESQLLDGSMDLTMGAVPARSVTMTATVPWTQSFSGFLDFSGIIKGNWQNEIQEEYPQPQSISSYTFKGLTSSWPKAGDNVGSGWTVRVGSLVDVSFLWRQELRVPEYFDTIPLPVPLPTGSFMYPPRITDGNYYAGVDGAGFNTTVDQLYVPIGWGVPTLVLNYNASRDYSEVITFTLKSAVQSIVTMPGEDESILLNLNANKVSDYIAGEVPIGNVSRASFFQTDRGKQAVQHLLMVARAAIVIKSRAVDIAFSPVSFRDGLDFTLRKNALVHNLRLPGGQAAGKIKSYTLSLDGSTGFASATAIIGCSVGYGGTYTASDGEPTYGEEDYMGPDYQEYTNVIELTDTSDLTYTVTPYSPNDDGVSPVGMFANNVLKAFSIFNQPGEQRAGMLALGSPDNEALNSYLQEHPTQVKMELVPLNAGPFLTNVEITLSDLIIPKQIDLEAASNA